MLKFVFKKQGLMKILNTYAQESYATLMFHVCTYTYNNICQPLWRFIFVRKSKKLDPSAQLKGFNYTRVYFNRITIAKRDVEGERERIEKQQDNSLCGKIR